MGTGEAVPCECHGRTREAGGLAARVTVSGVWPSEGTCLIIEGSSLTNGDMPGFMFTLYVGRVQKTQVQTLWNAYQVFWHCPQLWAIFSLYISKMNYGKSRRRGSSCFLLKLLHFCPVCVSLVLEEAVPWSNRLQGKHLVLEFLKGNLLFLWNMSSNTDDNDDDNHNDNNHHNNDDLHYWHCMIFHVCIEQYHGW